MLVTQYFDLLTSETAEIQTLRYRTLWRAALNQVFIDAFSNSKKRRNFKIKRLAKAFVCMQNQNFKFMCEMACYDPYMVFKHFKLLEKGKYRLGDNPINFI
jgi:hypothetical protein